MKIINHLSPKRYEEVEDLLSFIKIYDDDNRIRSYKRLLENNIHLIKGKVCLEAGCGLGIFSEFLSQLGARKVYAVELNPILYKTAKSRLKPYPNIEVINANVFDFEPKEPIDLVVHDFFGELLYDEQIFFLEYLPFIPKAVIPNEGVLRGGVARLADFKTSHFSIDVLKQLNNVLVSGLYKNIQPEFQFDVLKYKYKRGLCWSGEVNISKYDGDLLYFGLEVKHDGEKICAAGNCSNWKYAYTYRSADTFSISYKFKKRTPETFFKWIK